MEFLVEIRRHLILMVAHVVNPFYEALADFIDASNVLGDRDTERFVQRNPLATPFLALAGRTAVITMSPTRQRFLIRVPVRVKKYAA